MPSRQQDWLFRAWGEDAVVFDCASGDTHYLKPLTLALYQACRQNPGLNESEIVGLVSASMPGQIEADFSSMANEALTSLQRIGLLHIP